MTVFTKNEFPVDRTHLTPPPEKHQSSDRGVVKELNTGHFGLLKITNVLGSGVSGTVFAGKTEKDVSCVVKSFFEKSGSYERESTVYKLLNRHPSASFVKMLYVEEGMICLESARGYASLDEATERPSAEFLSKMAVCVTKGLKHLNGLKIVHRDIKPANILVNQKGLAKLIDFGHAFYLSNKKCTTKAGSWLYSCPAAILDIPYGHEADAWSLGVIVEELVTGKAMFSSAVCQSKTSEQIRVKVATIHRDHIGCAAPEEFLVSTYYPKVEGLERTHNRRKEFLKRYCATRGVEVKTAFSKEWSKNRNLLFALAKLADQCLRWDPVAIETVYEDLKSGIVRVSRGQKSLL